MTTDLSELCAVVLAREAEERPATPRLRLRASPRVTAPMPVMFEPMLYVVLQGAKRLVVGDRTIEHRAGGLAIMAVDLPATGHVTEASAAAPYLAIEMVLDPAAIASLLLDLPALAGPDPDVDGISVAALSVSLLDPLARLVRLTDAPGDAAVLAPLIEREILYRVLQGPQGGTLRQIGRPDSRVSRIGRTVAWMRAHVAEPVRVGVLADLAGMSATSFHRHFKAVTAMSPLAYHKQVRLQDARRRLLAEPGRAAQVAIAVGYESASQFSRDYKRQFGAPPARDAARLQREGAPSAP